MTAKELSQKTGLKLSRITQLTKGHRNGKYFYPAVFIEGHDFKRNFGRIEYTDKALESIENLRHMVNCRLCRKPFLPGKNQSICTECLNKQLSEVL